MIYVTGDIHGNPKRFSSKKFKEGKKLTKNDYVIILGDFGLYWGNHKDEIYFRKWLNDKPWTTLWIDGNHENFDLINQTHVDKLMFNGMVGYNEEYPSLIHLKRGEVYNIDNKTFFVMGGGYSLDKLYREEFISWWKQEMPTYEEYENGFKNLDKVNWKVNYILSHTASLSIRRNIIKKFNLTYKDVEEEIPLNNYLEDIIKKCEFDYYYFGHFHLNVEINDYIIACYELIQKIREVK